MLPKVPCQHFLYTQNFKGFFFLWYYVKIKVLFVTYEEGFLMISQEIDTA